MVLLQKAPGGVRDKSKWGKCTFTLALGVIVFLEVGFLVFANLATLADVAIEKDFGKLLRHVIEMGDKGTLFLPNWDYLTTAELDCAALLAVPLYVLTGNVFLAYGIADILNIGLWIWVLVTLATRLNLRKDLTLLSLAIILCPFAFGMLAYTNMMFYAGGQYVYKALLPILLVTLVLAPANKRFSGNNLVLLAVFFILLFLSALSSGLYVVGCGILPVTFFIVATSIGEKEFRTYGCLLIIGIAVCSAAGLLFCNLLGINPSSASVHLRSLSQLWYGCKQVVHDYFELFCLVPGQATSDSSAPGGVGYIARTIIVTLVTLVGVFHGFQCLYKVLIGAKAKTSDWSLTCLMGAALVFTFFWSSAVMVATISSPRYHLLGFACIVVAAVCGLHTMLQHSKKYVFIGKTALVILSLSLFIIFIASTVFFYRELPDLDNKDRYEKAEKIIQIMDEKSLSTCIFIEDPDLPEILRALDPSRVYETYIPSEDAIVRYDFYAWDGDRSILEGEMLVLEKGSTLSQCPQYLQDGCEKIATLEQRTDYVGSYTVYYFEGVRE